MGGSVDGGAGVDTITLGGTVALTLDGGKVANFEALTMTNTATVTQSGALALLGDGTITISAGTYSISSGGSLTGNSLTVSGGILSGAGGVTLGAVDSTFDLSGGMVGLAVNLGDGADTFTWTGGTFVTGGSVVGGDGSDIMALTVSSDQTLDGALFTGFEALTKAGSSALTLSGVLDLTSSGTVAIGAGTFAVASGATLTATSITLSGAETTLLMAGTYAGTVGVASGDVAGQVVEISSGGAFSGNVDLGGGTDDTLRLDVSAADITFTSAQAGYYMNIERMEVSGSNDVTWGANLIVGAATGFQTLEFSASGITFAAGASTSGTLTFMDGATIDLSGLGAGNASLTLTADTVILPTATTNGGLTILLPDGWGDVLTLTIANVMGNTGDTQASVLGKFTVRDVNSTPNAGLVWLVGGINPDYTTGTYTLNLQAELVGDAATTSGPSSVFIMSAGYYTSAWPPSAPQDDAASITLSGGVFAPSTAVVLGSSNSAVTWSGGEIRRNIDTTPGAGDDSLILRPGTSVTLNFDGSQFISFETLTKDQGAGTVVQTGTLDLSTSGTITITTGTYTLSGSDAEILANTLTIGGGTLSGAGSVVLSDSASTFTLSSGTVDVAVDLGAGVDTFTWSGGSIGSGGSVDGGAGSDTIALSGTTALALTGSSITNFEVLTMTSTAMVTQTGTLALTANISTITISAGTYNISTGGVLQGTSLTVDGGTLMGAGSVTLDSGAGSFTFSSGTVDLSVDLGAGDDTFTWSGGAFTNTGDVAGGAGSDTMAFSGDGNLTFSGSQFTGFEAFTKAGSGNVAQSDTLNLGASGVVTVSGGGTYKINSGATLTAGTLELIGAGSKLVVGGSFSGTVAGDAAGQEVEVSSVTAFAGAVDLAGGEDTLIIDTSSAALSFDATQAGYYSNIETFWVSGGNGVTWAAPLTFGDTTDWQTLQFSTSGSSLTVTGALTFMDGATLDLSKLVAGDASLTLTGTTIVLPASANGLTITLPETWVDVLTLTLENVVGGMGVTQSIVLGKFLIEDAAAAPIGFASVSGTAPTFTAATYTLVLEIVLEYGELITSNTGGTFTLTSGYYSDAFPTTDGATPVTNLTVVDGIFSPSATAELVGNSRLIWQDGRIRRGIDASAGSGVDTIDLQPAANVDLSLDGSLFTGFEALVKSGAGTVTQSGTLQLGTNGSITINAGTYTISGSSSDLRGTSLLVTGGTLDGAGSVLLVFADSFTLSGGTVDVTVDLGAGNDTFAWSGGSLGSSAMIDGSGDTDTIALSGTTALTLDGSKIANFEVLTMASTATVTQDGDFDLGTSGSATFSAGTYTIATGESLTVNSLTVNGGILSGAGSVTMGSAVSSFTFSSGMVGLSVNLDAGDDTFTWTGGTFITGGSVAGGAGSDTMALTVSSNQTLNGALFTGFEALTKAGSSTLTLSGALDLTSTGTVAITAGTFTVASGATLTATSITLSGAETKLVMAGTYTGTVGVASGDTAGQVVEISSAGAFAGAVDLGAGVDTLIIDTSGAALTFSATQAGYYSNIETLSVSGSNGVTWADPLTFGDTTGWQTLQFSTSGSSLTVTGALTFMDGATLDLSKLADADASLTLTGSTIVLPASALGLTITLPVTWVNVLTLTLENVVGGSDTQNVVLGKLQIEDAEAAPIGVASVSGTAPDFTAGTYTLVLEILLEYGVLVTSNVGGLFTLTSGYYNETFPATTSATPVTNLTVVGGIFSPSATAELVGDSRLTWSGGRIRRGIDATDGTGVDTIDLQPALDVDSNLVNLSIDGSLLVGFEALVKSGAGTVTQSGNLSLSTSGSMTISAGTYTLSGSSSNLVLNTLLITGGTLDGAGTVLFGGTVTASTFTFSGGTVDLTVALGTDNDTFNWSGGSLGSSAFVGGGPGRDTIAISGSTALTLDSSKIGGFAVLTMASTATVTQAGNFDLGTSSSSATFSAGTYTIATGESLTTNSLTVNGGILSGAGSVTMGSAVNTFEFSSGTVGLAVNLGGGDDAFNWSAGTFTSGGSVDGGAGGSDSIGLLGDGDFALDGSKFTNFEILTKAGTGKVTQTNALTLAGGNVTITGGGTYEISSGATLTANTLALNGDGSKLIVGGSYTGTVTGDGDGQVVEISSVSAFAAGVDLAGGVDTLIIDASGGALTFSATQAGYYSNIETLSVSGANNVSWGAGLTFGAATGWQTLKFSDSGRTFTVAGTLTFMNGSVIDLTGLSNADATLTLTATSIVLPTDNEGLTIMLPTSWTNFLTLTLENVAGVAGATELSVLDKFLVSDADGAPIGVVSLTANVTDFTVTFTLSVTAELVYGPLVTSNVGGLFTLTSGHYNEDFAALSAANRVTNMNIDGGIFNPTNAVELSGDSAFRWQDGRVRRAIDASDGSGDDRITLEPGSGVTLGLSGALFVDFEVLSMAGVGSVTQSGTLDLGIGGAATISSGSYVIANGGMLLTNSLTLSGGSLSGAGSVTLKGLVRSLTLSGGSLGVAVSLGSNDDTFTWSSGVMAVGGEVDGGAGDDTLVFNGGSGVSIAVDGGDLSSFEVLTKSGAGTVTQSGTLSLGVGGAATISAGTYSISSGGELQGNVLTVSGGALSGAGSVVMGITASTFTLSGGTVGLAVDLGAGADTFAWSGGTIAAGGAVAGGAGSDTIALSGSGDFALDGSVLTGFEALTKAGSGTASLSSSLSLGSAGTVVVNGGGFSVASGATLTATSITLNGAGSKLVMGSSFAGTVGGDGDGQIVEVSSASAFAANVDLAGGEDTLVVDSSAGDLTFSAAQTAYYMNIETLSVSGANNVTWQAGLTFGAATGWQTLQLAHSSATFTVAGTLTFMDGSVIDLTTLNADSVLTVSATTVNLPSATADGGLTIRLAPLFANSLKITLENVVGSNSFTTVTLLALFSVVDSNGVPGFITIDGAAPDFTAASFDLSLEILVALPEPEVSRDDAESFVIDDGGYVVSDEDLSTMNLIVNDGVIVTDDNSKIVLTGDSVFDWTDGRVLVTVDATDGTGADEIDLTPASDTTLSLVGDRLIGFENLKLDGDGMVVQSGLLDLTAAAASVSGTGARLASSHLERGVVDISDGTYTISRNGILRANHLQVSGGMLRSAVTGAGAGKVELIGDSEVAYSGGSIGVVVDATDGTGDDTLALTAATGGQLDVDGDLFLGFEVLTKDGAGRVLQMGALTLAATGSATFSGGGIYEVGSGATLSSAGGVSLVGDGTTLVVSGGNVVGAVTGDEGDQTVVVDVATAFAANVDLGDGEDQLFVDVSDTSLTFTATQAGYYQNIEILHVSGSRNFNWGSSLAIGGSGGDFDTLRLSGGSSNFATSLTFADGSTLDLVGLRGGDSSVTLDTASNMTITLPTTSTNGGLTIKLSGRAGDAQNVTLTLNNVAALTGTVTLDDVLDSIQVVDVLGFIEGTIELSGSAPDTASDFDLVLSLAIEASFVSAGDPLSDNLAKVQQMLPFGSPGALFLTEAVRAVNGAGNREASSLQFAASLVPQDYAALGSYASRNLAFGMERLLERLEESGGSSMGDNDLVASAQGWVSTSRHASQLDSSKKEDGFENLTYLNTAGIDFSMPNSSTKFGVFLGSSKLQQDSNSNDRTDIANAKGFEDLSLFEYRGASMGVYGQTLMGDFRISGLFTYTDGETELKGQAVVAGGVQQRRDAKFDMSVMSAQLRASWLVDYTFLGMTLTPVADLLVTVVDREAVKETRTIGDFSTVLNISDDSSDALLGYVGFNMSRQDEYGSRMGLSLGWRQELQDGTSETKTTFAEAPDAGVFSTEGRTPWSGALSLSADLTILPSFMNGKGTITFYVEQVTDFDEYQEGNIGIRFSSHF